MLINEELALHNDCKVLVNVSKVLYHIDFRLFLILNYFVFVLSHIRSYK